MQPDDTSTARRDAPITGRCYCGGTRLEAACEPELVAYCHCEDCRRITGAPVTAFAAFAPGKLSVTPELGAPLSVTPGVERWFCPRCGSPLAARFDYLPGQIYVPVGLLDEADQLSPQMHSHWESRLPWLHIVDDIERNSASSRDSIVGKGTGTRET